MLYSYLSTWTEWLAKQKPKHQNIYESTGHQASAFAKMLKT